MDALGEVSLDRDGTSCSIFGTTLSGGTRTELERKLARTIYRALHSGEPVDRDADVRLRTPWLERELVSAIPHRFTRVATRVLGLSGRQLLIEVDGLRIVVGADNLDDREPSAGGLRVVSLPAIRPALSPGFLLVDGSRGAPRGGAIARIYLHLSDATTAEGVWAAALALLEDCGARYRAKILSSAELYPRRDGIVVYLDRAEWPLVRPLTLRLTGVEGVGEQVSEFAYAAARGIGVASEPGATGDGGRPLSFGQHRARAVATGILKSARKRNRLESAIAEELRSAGVDPDRPFIAENEVNGPDHWLRLLQCA
ncbi:hypothetical protein CDO52_08580 [Nocardiopsis gilva YIM 90087]|uniref:Uncharacterized protein n=1 Tax=Nocardiopsis gilva YIM 90087 TaxID=1235441 RepID=A0A223S476_9ACTN|nr:T3SS effector HopA1 family protein [Nocardiopsis gilva]ASU82829.1 hypothetical protein CDO52_08580 [Nocardiopsis gilva YIM 90087]